jgi:hypothetical protein
MYINVLIYAQRKQQQIAIRLIIRVVIFVLSFVRLVSAIDDVIELGLSCIQIPIVRIVGEIAVIATIIFAVDTPCTRLSQPRLRDPMAERAISVVSPVTTGIAQT